MFDLSPPLSVLGNRYRLLGLVGKGGMGAVYRAEDRLTGQIVALKRVTAPVEDLQFASRLSSGSSTHHSLLALAVEFRTLAGLHHPNIISVLDYGFDSRTSAPQPYFTMQLVEGGLPITSGAAERPQSQKVEFLIAVLWALAYLHRRGIIHRDLKPGNVLINRDGAVKVMDFGLALHQSHSISDAIKGAAGTMAYMAPELFAEEEATIQSDLFACGVVAYELFTGQLPFKGKNIALLINSILNANPDLSGVDSGLAPVIERLLAKNPAERYSSAEAVIEALCLAVGQSVPQEDAALRESFLQAARFIGRETELERLKTALDDALAGKGSAWLVGGESGIGKSRLLEELRVRALVSGALVLRGQSIENAGLPYQSWREVIRRLALTTKLSDLEAGVLKELAPDIDALLEREVSAAPPLDGKASENRLLLTIAGLFRRQAQPVVLILEDLHWATESLKPLRYLIGLVSELPLLIIGSYRDDERPGLPDELPGMQVLKLPRLDEAAIADLSASMLGEAGRQAAVLDLLERETEGNAFFMVEVVRALAEDAGRLSDVGRKTLPQHVFSGGIQQVVRRRLSRVPENGRERLRLAAVAGRQIDRDVLATLSLDSAPVSEAEFDSWLTACANAAVLEAHDGGWRFAHDKLREGLLATVAPDDLPHLHLRVAQTIERVHAGERDSIPALAFHYQQAGIRDKAAHYLAQAAELAQANYANQEALNLYQAAIDQVEALLAAGDQPERWQALLAQLREGLGVVLELTGHHDEARRAYEAARTLFTDADRLQQSRLLCKVAQTWTNQRLYEEALRAYGQAETVLGEKPDGADTDWWRAWLGSYLGRMGHYYWIGDAQAMNDLRQQISPVLEQYGTPGQRSTFFSNCLCMLNLACLYHNTPDEALDYGRKAITAAQEEGNAAQEWLVRLQLGVTHLWRSELDEAEEQLQITLRLGERLGDVTILARIWTYLTIVRRKRGLVEAVCEYARRSLEVAALGQMQEYIAIAQANLAWAALRAGNLAEAEASATTALELIRNTAQARALPWIVLWPVIGLRLAQGQIAEVIEPVCTLLAPGTSPPPDELKALLETAIHAWEQGDAQTAATTLQEACALAREEGYL